MRPIQYYIGILLVLEYAYCLPLAGQVKDKVAREGGGRLEYTEVKTERSTDGKMLTVSFKIADSLNRLGAQEMLYIYPSVYLERKDTGLLSVRKLWATIRIHWFL